LCVCVQVKEFGQEEEDEEINGNQLGPEVNVRWQAICVEVKKKVGKPRLSWASVGSRERERERERER
jgi:hypothetical protein